MQRQLHVVPLINLILYQIKHKLMEKKQQRGELCKLLGLHISPIFKNNILLY